MKNPKKIVLILTDDKPGHVNQSLGLAKALESSFTVEQHKITVLIRFKALRFVMRVIANWIPSYFLRLTLPFFYKIEGEYKGYNSPIIISSGGNTLYASIVIKALTKGLNLYSGSPKQFSPSLIDLIYSAIPLAGVPNNIVLGLPPSNISKPNGSYTKNSYALLIGGDGAGYRYNTKDWELMINGIHRLSEVADATWLVTTSRRSGKQIENLLDKTLKERVVSRLVLYGRNPEKVIGHFLQEAEIIFCTEESLTMVSEAIYSGKKVYTLIPNEAAPDNNDSCIITSYQTSGLIERCLLSDLATLTPSVGTQQNLFLEIDKKISASVTDALKRHVKNQDT